MFLIKEPFFWVLFSAHLLGDFYFQSSKMADEKRNKWSVLLGHCVLYAGCMFAVALLMGGTPALWCAGVAAIGHGIVDTGKHFVERWLSRCYQGWVLLIDQLVHIGILFGTVIEAPVIILPGITAGLKQLGCTYSISALLRLGCLALLLGKPANIALKQCNQKPPRNGKENDSESEALEEVTERQAGAIIGTLERMLTATLFLLGSYGTISVIFAAKTLTRYKKITDNPEFGEYYLIGTLGSILIAIFAVFILFPPG